MQSNLILCFQLLEKVKSSERTSRAAKELEAAAAVKMARATTVLHESQQEILKMKQKVGDYDAIRMQLYRLRLKAVTGVKESVAYACSSHPGSDLTSSTPATRSSERQQQPDAATSRRAAVLDFLRNLMAQAEKSADICLPPPFEILLRANIKYSKSMATSPSAISLGLLLQGMLEHCTAPEIIRLLAHFLPASFFGTAGILLNEEVKRIGPAPAGTSFRSRWAEDVSGTWCVFMPGLFATQSSQRGIVSTLHEKAVAVRALVIYAIVSFTLDARDNLMVQRPVASLLDSAGVATTRDVLGTMGISMSERTHSNDGSTRAEQSRRILQGVLNAWTQPYKFLDGSTVIPSIRIHEDNLDMRDIHVLCVGVTRLDPPESTEQRPRLLIYEIEPSSIEELSEIDKQEAQLEFKKRLEKATTTKGNSSAEAEVLRLLSALALDESITAMSEKRASTTRGAKSKGPTTPEGQLLTADLEAGGLASTVSIKSDFVANNLVSFRSGELCALLYSFLDDREAVIQNPAGDIARVPFRHITEYAELQPRADRVGTAKACSNQNFSLASAAALVCTERLDVSAMLLCDSAADDTPTSPLAGESGYTCFERAKFADNVVAQRVHSFFAAPENRDLPRPQNALSSLVIGLFDGVASNRADATAAIKHAVEKLNVSAEVFKAVSVDGQEFYGEMSFRDHLRHKYQADINRLDLELSLEGQLPATRAGLEAHLREAVKQRNDVSDMTAYEVGQLHTAMTLVRAIFKQHEALALGGLLDRIGLGHVHDHVAECKAVFLKTCLEMFDGVAEGWLVEILLLKDELAYDGSLQEFIELHSKSSITVKVYNRALFTDLSIVLDMHTSEQERGEKASRLLVSAQKRALHLVATGGCPNYLKMLAWSLRDRLDSSPSTRQILDSNPTTAIREVTNGDGEHVYDGTDTHLEREFIKPIKAVIVEAHRSNVLSKGSELNVTIGRNSALIVNVGRGTNQREREHRTRLNRALVVSIVRASVRRFVIPRIKAELSRSQSGPSSSAASDFSIAPRIPTRAEEASEAKRGASRAKLPNPEYNCLKEIAAGRVHQAACWVLRKSIGGRCDASESLSSFPVPGFYLRAKGGFFALGRGCW